MVVLVAVVGCDVVTYISRRISAGLARATLGRHFSCAVRPALECSAVARIAIQVGQQVGHAIPDASLANLDVWQHVFARASPSVERRGRHTEDFGSLLSRKHVWRSGGVDGSGHYFGLRRWIVMSDAQR